MTTRASKQTRARAATVHVEIYDAVETLYGARATLAPGLRYARELSALWDPGEFDAERFVTQGILAVALAKLAGGRVIGWGQLLVARPRFDDTGPRRGWCRISRLDVAPGYRRRTFVETNSGTPVSELLLRALLGAAPYGTEVLAEVTPDAENLFEKAGFKMLDAGRWRYSR